MEGLTAFVVIMLIFAVGYWINRPKKADVSYDSRCYNCGIGLVGDWYEDDICMQCFLDEN